MTSNLVGAYPICQFLRENLSGTRIVLGGAHFDSNPHPEEIFDYFDVDFVVKGEGEYTLLELVQNLHDPINYKYIKGLSYKDVFGEVHVNSPREVIEDLDALPFPDYEDLYDGHPFYGTPYSRTGRMIALMTSRGCPFRCTFCDVPYTLGRKIRSRSVENIIEEIKVNQKKYGIDEVIFKDSNFHLDPSYVQEFSEQVLKSDLKISFIANYRVEAVKESIVRPLKEAGCWVVFCGIESVTPDVQRALGKPSTMEQIRNADALLRQHDVKRFFSFMFGSPNETEESMRSALDFALETDPFIFSAGPTTVFPGTPLYDYAIENNLLKDPQWWFYFLRGDEEDSYPGRLLLENLPPEKVSKFISFAYRKFYLRPSKAMEMFRFYGPKRFFSAIAPSFLPVVKMSKKLTESSAGD